MNLTYQMCFSTEPSGKKEQSVFKTDGLNQLSQSITNSITISLTTFVVIIDPSGNQHMCLKIAVYPAAPR